MDATPGLRKHSIDMQKRRSPSVTHVIKTRNSPRSAYIRDFQHLSQLHTVNVHRDVYKCLDLATAFHGLTIVTFMDENSDPQPSTSKPNMRPFFYESPSSLPTTTEEAAKIPDLVEIPIPEEVEQDKVEIENSDWSPPPLAYRQVTHKSRNSTLLPDKDKEACPHCGKIRRKSWPGWDKQ